MPPSGDLFRVSARAAVDLLRKGEVSPLDMVDAAAARIEATDGALNALPTPCIERARDHARRIMAGGPAPARGGGRGPAGRPPYARAPEALGPRPGALADPDAHLEGVAGAELGDLFIRDEGNYFARFHEVTCPVGKLG